MPIPIRPANSSDSGFSNYFPVNMDLLQNDLWTNASLKKTALVNDGDADVLFYIWKNSSVISNNEEVENKTYRIKDNVKKEDVLKLKASGLIVGDDKEIRFTNRAANIIKTMVLGEQNSFGKQSIKKPYSIILAEQLKPKRKSALALASKIIDSQDGDMLKIADALPDFKDKKYYYNERVISKGIASATSNKEYNARVYLNDDGKYELWFFWGKTDGTLQSKKEGTYGDAWNATHKAQEMISAKKYGPNQYKPAQEWGYSSVNESIPGTKADKEKKEKDTTENTFTKIKKYKPKTCPICGIITEKFDDSSKMCFKCKLHKEQKEHTKKMEKTYQKLTKEDVKELKEKLLEKNIEKGKEKFKKMPIKKEKLTLEQLIKNPPDNLDVIKDPELKSKYFDYLLNKGGASNISEAETRNPFNKQGVAYLEEKLLSSIKIASEKPEYVLSQNEVSPAKSSSQEGLRKNILENKNVTVEDVVKAIRNRVVLFKEIPNPSFQLVERLIHEFKGNKSIPIPERTIINFLNSSGNIAPETLEILASYRKIYANKYRDCENPELKSQIVKALFALEQKLLEKVVTGKEDWALEIVKEKSIPVNEIKNPVLRKRYWNYLLDMKDDPEDIVQGNQDNVVGEQATETPTDENVINLPKKTIEDYQKEYLERQKAK